MMLPSVSSAGALSVIHPRIAQNTPPPVKGLNVDNVKNHPRRAHRRAPPSKAQPVSPRPACRNAPATTNPTAAISRPENGNADHR